MRTLWSIPALAIALVACREMEPSGTDAGGPIPDLNAVHGDFIAALKERLWSETGSFETCVLDPETTVYWDDREQKDPGRWETFKTALPDLRRDTYDSFWNENERPRPIAPTDRDAMKLHVLTKTEEAELDGIAQRGRFREYWDTFHARYRKAVHVQLSAAGFSADRRQAVIYYAASFDFLAAWGCYCLLEREADRWVISGSFCVWVS